VSGYGNTVHVEERPGRGKHRAIVGGMWDEIGILQLEFLKNQGLRPSHTFIDIGSGSFRAGVRIVPYLDFDNYYAIDPNPSLLEAGYSREIEPAGLSRRFPCSNYAVTDRFDISGFHRSFDFGIAQSVFTHLPITKLTECLAAVASHFRPGGELFVTMFIAPEGQADAPFKQPVGGVITAPDKDPFHTTIAGLLGVAERTSDWRMTIIGSWNHPRNQQMVCFTRRLATSLPQVAGTAEEPAKNGGGFMEHPTGEVDNGSLRVDFDRA
jgi:hypothetical protein